MNNMLDSSSPLEPLAFNYVAFGIFTVVNNLWAWVAIITAAISFWTIRTTAFSDSDKPVHHRNTSGSQAQPSANTSSVEAAPPCPIRALPSVKGVDGVTEGSKYTLYYYEEERRESDGDGEVTTVVKEWRGDADDDDGVSSCGEWWQWERVRMRGSIGDMEWYRCQDLTVVNGNVVRLWDECRRRSEKSCCYSSCCCAIWSLVN